MVTAKQACIGFVILFLLALLIVVAAMYWVQAFPISWQMVPLVALVVEVKAVSISCRCPL